MQSATLYVRPRTSGSYARGHRRLDLCNSSRPTPARTLQARASDGFGVRFVVERGALEVHDGVGQHRRTRRCDRATHGLRRLVILNAAGVVSLEALRWCQALDVGVLVLGGDGTAQLASTPG